MSAMKISLTTAAKPVDVVKRRMQRRARTSASARSDYGLLEPRQLLAAITVVDINDSLQPNLETDSLVAYNGGAAGVANYSAIGSELVSKLG